MTVSRRLTRNFPGLIKGANLAFASDLPPASGMSSSSAFIIASCLALEAVSNLSETSLYRENIHSREDLAGYLATIENGMDFGALKGDKGVGTFGGSEDHIAILRSRAGMLIQYAYAPVRFEQLIALPSGMTFAVCSSGIQAEKTGAARDLYNSLSLMTRELCDYWNRTHQTREPNLAAILSSDKNAIHHLRKMAATLDEHQPGESRYRKRLDHFFKENFEIIPAATQALLIGDLDAFGHWSDRSQQAAESLLGNQIPETVFLAKSARKLGAVAASAFGAGFGGSVWALVQKDNADAFLQSWQEAFIGQFPQASSSMRTFLSAPAPAAFEL